MSRSWVQLCYVLREVKPDQRNARKPSEAIYDLRTNEFVDVVRERCMADQEQLMGTGFPHTHTHRCNDHPSR